MKLCQGERAISLAITTAVGVNDDCRREVLGRALVCSEAATFLDRLLRKLTRRGLRGVQRVISDAREGLKGAMARVLNAT